MKLFNHLGLCFSVFLFFYIQIIVCIFLLFFSPFFSHVLATISVQIFALVLSQFHLSHQDDSDDETPTAKRAHGHSDGLEFMDFSCEEGEETASSDGHTEVLYGILHFTVTVMSHLQAPVVFIIIYLRLCIFGEILNKVLLFLICSGQWIGWQWTGFVQWWGRVE